MNQTDNINELVAALSKAQSKMKPAVFNKVNPHFKNRYADFTACMDACRIPLSDHGLSIMQYCETINDKLTLVTMLAHISGQWIKSNFPLIPKSMDSQGIGSAMTYAKRYSLSAMLGIVSDEEDDDGESSVGRGQQQATAPKPIKKQKISPDQLRSLVEIENQLDEESKHKLYKWLNTSHKIDSLSDLTTDELPKVVVTFENALKFVKAQEKDKQVQYA